MNDYTVTSYTVRTDGKTYDSMDVGKTWTPMTGEEFNAASGWNDVEWWTAEEHATWLEQENGQLVSRFSDVSPDGSAFSFTSADEGGISV